MYIPCNFGNGTFYLQFIPPLRLKVECTECGEIREVGGEGGHDVRSDTERREREMEGQDGG